MIKQFVIVYTEIRFFRWNWSHRILRSKFYMAKTEIGMKLYYIHISDIKQIYTSVMALTMPL